MLPKLFEVRDGSEEFAQRDLALAEAAGVRRQVQTAIDTCALGWMNVGLPRIV